MAASLIQSSEEQYSSRHEEGNAYFQKAAQGWDDRKDMQDASRGAAAALRRRIPSLNRIKVDYEPDVLEVGCGTGLLTGHIAPLSRSFVALDACDSMIGIVSSKCRHLTSFENVEPICTMLTDPEDGQLPALNPEEPNGPRRKFHLVLSHLLLHHVADLESLFTTMFGCLRPGGWVALTDFEDFGAEAELFHPQAKTAGVERHGICRDEMRALLLRVGFVDVAVETGFLLRKEVERWPGEWGAEKPEELQAAEMDFPILMVTARRPRMAASSL